MFVIIDFRTGKFFTLKRWFFNYTDRLGLAERYQSEPSRKECRGRGVAIRTDLVFNQHKGEHYDFIGKTHKHS